MRNSSDENQDRRPILPSIWDLFRDELSEPSSRYQSSSIHSLPIDQDRRYDGWVPNHLVYQDHPSTLPVPGHGPSGEKKPIIQHQVPDAPIPQPYYCSPQEVHQTQGDPSLYHDLGINLIPPNRKSTPTPSVDYLPSTDSLNHRGRFPQTAQFLPSSDRQAVDDETNPGASYNTFRCFQPSLETHGESGSNARYECQYCGKAFYRPSSLRIHVNSHTGEKPFVCPVEGCGRSFSVLSNMRRHARVHAQPATREGTAQSSGGGTSSRDHRQTSMALRRSCNSSPWDNSDGK